jgi:hypothetical protein
MLSPHFIRNAIQFQSCQIIESVCAKCGASKMASRYEGLLKAWEDGHECTDYKLLGDTPGARR